MPIVYANILSISTIFGNILIALLIIALLIRKFSSESIIKEYANKFLWIFGKHGMLFAFLISLSAMLGSLFFSDVIGFEPCKLCWYERIFMYPQVFILGIALWKKDYSVKVYAITLSVIGVLIALYHYYIQMFGLSDFLCDSAGSCSQRYVFTYGYITIPFMSAVAFTMVILFIALSNKSE